MRRLITTRRKMMKNQRMISTFLFLRLAECPGSLDRQLQAGLTGAQPLPTHFHWTCWQADTPYLTISGGVEKSRVESLVLKQ